MTTDFAMQNVCKQMGLNMIGTNGMMIRCARSASYWPKVRILSYDWSPYIRCKETM